MNIVDLIIIIFLIFGFLLGFKRGFTRQMVSFLGIFLVLGLSYLLKNPLASILYNSVSFMPFKALDSLNILFYESISFIIIFIISSILLKVLSLFTSFFEKVLKKTIILGIPSKILGGILGLLQNYIYVFVILYFLSFPIFSIQMINNSKLSNIILNNTPLVSERINSKLNLNKKINEIKNKYENNEDEYNRQINKLLLENKIISKKDIEK